MKKSILALALLSALGLSACNESTTEESSELVNASPIVDAGEEQTVAAGQEVTLLATIIDDDNVTISWSQVSGSTVTLNQSNSNTVTFIAPELQQEELLSFKITVDDGVNSPVTDTIDIIVAAVESSELASWLINNETSASYIQSASGNVLEDVQSAEVVDIDENNI